MTDSPLEQLRALLTQLESELTVTESATPPSDPRLASDYNLLLKMTRVSIATLRAAIVTIEAIENATAVYAALRTGRPSRELLN